VLVLGRVYLCTAQRGGGGRGWSAVLEKEQHREANLRGLAFFQNEDRVHQGGLRAPRSEQQAEEAQLWGFPCRALGNPIRVPPWRVVLRTGGSSAIYWHNLIFIHNSLAHWTGSAFPYDLKPSVETWPAVQVSTVCDNRFTGQFKTYVAFKRRRIILSFERQSRLVLRASQGGSRGGSSCL